QGKTPAPTRSGTPHRRLTFHSLWQCRGAIAAASLHGAAHPPGTAGRPRFATNEPEIAFFCRFPLPRAGSADLPSDGGRVPAGLGQRMSRLGSVITQAIVHHSGRAEFLGRLAHPFWFQSFGAVMGMDWHSSGITTSVIGALKRGLAPLS